MSPGFKKYNALSDSAKTKVDNAFDKLLEDGGTTNTN